MAIILARCGPLKGDRVDLFIHRLQKDFLAAALPKLNDDDSTAHFTTETSATTDVVVGEPLQDPPEATGTMARAPTRHCGETLQYIRNYREEAKANSENALAFVAKYERTHCIWQQVVLLHT